MAASEFAEEIKGLKLSFQITVDYFGHTLILCGDPKIYKYLATDMDGEIWAYEKKPMPGEYGHWEALRGEVDYVDKLQGITVVESWKESLMEVQHV